MEEDYLGNLMESTKKCPDKFADSWENILRKRRYGTSGLAQYGHPDLRSVYSVVCWGIMEEIRKKSRLLMHLWYTAHICTLKILAAPKPLLIWPTRLFPSAAPRKAPCAVQQHPRHKHPRSCPSEAGQPQHILRQARRGIIKGHFITSMHLV